MECASTEKLEVDVTRKLGRPLKYANDEERRAARRTGRPNGRPRIHPIPEILLEKRKPGRPIKYANDEERRAAQRTGRPNGRPRIHPLPTVTLEKRKAGRPRQYAEGDIRKRHICEHGHHRYQCTQCGGPGICEHGHRRYTCNQCLNLVCDQEGCHLQGHRFAGVACLMHHMRVYHTDNPKALTKSKELNVHMMLTEASIDFEYQRHLPFKGCDLRSETSYCLIDFVIQKNWGIVFLECDEEQHSAYPTSCDVRRDFDICASIALGSQHKAVMLRYNPDAFKVAGVTRRTSQRDRRIKLLETLHAWDEDPAPNLLFARFFMFYDAESDEAVLPIVAHKWAPEVSEVSFRVF
jgi:hypothetical protein